MRALLYMAILFAALLHPSAARAQSIAASARVVAPQRLRVAGEAPIERGPRGRDSIATTLTLSHATRLRVAVQQRSGDPECTLTARAGAAWQAELRCTRARRTPHPQVVRLLRVPAA